MRTGVILLTSSASEDVDRLSANLQAKDISVLQCREDMNQTPETIRDFIAGNRLEALLVSSISRASPPDFLRYAIEEAGLRRLAVSWIDLALLSEERLSGSSANTANMTVLANVARLQCADHIRSAVFRSLRGSSKVSRRELFRSIPKVLMVESDIPIVLADRCKDRSKSCNYCVVACPVYAVSAASEAVTINDRLCIECGACARDCPIGAIQSPSVSDVQIIAMLNALASEEPDPNKRALMLTCPIGFERLLDEGRKGKRLGAGIVPVQIPCVSFIGSVHYLWAASLGVTLATVCPDISCKKAVAMFPLYQHVASSRNLLKDLREDTTNSVHHLGLHANDSIVDFVSQALTSTSAVGVSAKLSGSFRHELVVDAIRGLRNGSSGSIELSEDGTLPLFDLKVDEVRCSFCEACQRDCPDHAIEFTKSDDGTSLMFDPALCGGCMICERNCPEKAITVSRLKDFSPILERKKAARAQDANAKCENCGTFLGPKRSLTALKKRLSDQGATEATIKALNLCIRCKQRTLIQPLGQHLQI
jgi:NAD-dependent dihydropyrimidine dehydrogenase PreA subunit